MTTATRAPTAHNDEVKVANGHRNLYQRLAAVEAAVGKIKATGKTEYGQKAMSIEDVDDAVRELFGEHGIVSGYTFRERPEIIGKEGKNDIWLADLDVWLVNAGAPEERRQDRVVDVGTSPSAAVSFALKRYFRALLHLADAGDEQRATARERTDAASGFTTPRAAREQPPQGRTEAAPAKPAIACPTCGKAGSIIRRSDGRAFCAVSKDGCGHTLSAEELQEATAKRDGAMSREEVEDAKEAARAGVEAAEPPPPDGAEQKP